MVLVAVLSSCATGHSLAEGAASSLDQMKIQGPWAYNDDPNPQAGTASHIAITQSEENSEIWFSFACAKPTRILASIVGQIDAHEAARDDVSVVVRLLNITPLRTVARRASDTFMAFNPELSRKLFIYAIHAKTLQVTFSSPKLGLQTYTFQLQPNRVAFRGIIDACMPKYRNQEL
jgi:hypothetical protein